MQRNLSRCALASAGLLPLARPCLAQETRPSLAGEAAAEQQAQSAIPPRYNIPLWGGGVSASAALEGLYYSNVYLQHDNTKDDFILSPQLKLGAFFPIGRLNTLALDLGTAYYQYFKNDNLNTGVPLVNPDSKLAFSIYTGDFVIKLTESFSYQESPFFEYGGTFYNVYNSGLFRRFDNLAGPSVTWDLHHLVLHASYNHENFWPNDPLYNYIARASEIFTADAMLTLRPWLIAGLEANGNLTSYDIMPWDDNWRAGAGPAARLSLSEFVNARAGGGFQAIQFDPKWQPLIGQTATDTFYAYGGLDQRLNPFLRHSLNVSHDNLAGINAANLEGTHVRYTLNWIPREHWSLSSYFDLSFYHESLGYVNGARYSETFTLFLPGLKVGYQIVQNVRADLSFSYLLLDADKTPLSYDQDRAALTVTYQF